MEAAMAYENLPKDPMILLSFINTNLRDYYSNLETLCDDKKIDKEKLEADLAAIDYHYDKKLNRFV